MEGAAGKRQGEVQRRLPLTRLPVAALIEVVLSGRHAQGRLVYLETECGALGMERDPPSLAEVGPPSPLHHAVPGGNGHSIWSVCRYWAPTPALGLDCRWAEGWPGGAGHPQGLGQPSSRAECVFHAGSSVAYLWPVVAL